MDIHLNEIFIYCVCIYTLLSVPFNTYYVAWELFGPKENTKTWLLKHKNQWDIDRNHLTSEQVYLKDKINTLEEELETTKQNLKETNKSKDDFLTEMVKLIRPK